MKRMPGPAGPDLDRVGLWLDDARGARKDTGGDGWADVWKRHYFAWEYKGHRATLAASVAVR